MNAIVREESSELLWQTTRVFHQVLGDKKIPRWQADDGRFILAWSVARRRGRFGISGKASV
jgi:hypothetical protein